MAVMTKGAWKKIYSGEIQQSTTSENLTNIATITVDGSYTDGKIIYCKIRDKAGKRSGYYYGNDTFVIKGTQFGTCVYSYDGSTKSYATVYGIYARAISSDGDVTLASRYNSTYTKTIDGTYSVEIYQLDWPDDSSPFT